MNTLIVGIGAIIVGGALLVTGAVAIWMAILDIKDGETPR